MLVGYPGGNIQQTDGRPWGLKEETRDKDRHLRVLCWR